MLWKSINYGIGAFGLVFFSCELGQRFSNSFDLISDIMIGKLSWYLLPVESQRLLLFTIMNVQRPVVIKCFGNILCGREQFKKVRLIDMTYLLNVHCAIDLIYWNQIRSAMLHTSTLRCSINVTSKCKHREISTE